MIKVRVRDRVDRPGWQLVYSDPLTGKPRTRSAGTDDRKQAEREAQKWEEELNAGKFSGKTDWDSFTRRFTDEHLADKSFWTKQGYRKAFKSFVTMMGKPRDISLITPSTLSEWKGKLTANGKAVDTVANYPRHLMAALSWAEEIGLIHRTPRVRLPRRKEGKIRALTAAEFQLLLEKAQDSTDADPAELTRLLRVLWLLGLRLDESRKIAWDSGLIQIDLDGGKHPRLIFSAEGHKGRRDEITPIPPDAAEWLRQTPPSKRKGLLCPVHDRGKLMSLDDLSAAVSAIGKATGIDLEGDHPTAKDLRSAFASRWALKVRPITLQKLMRHRSILTTLRYYIGITCDDIGEELYRPLTVDGAVDAGGKSEKATRKKTKGT